MKHHIAPHLDLLAIVESFLSTSGMSKSAFGFAAVGDPNFVDGLRAGRECRRRTVQRVMEYITTGEVYDAEKHSRRRKTAALNHPAPPPPGAEQGSPDNGGYWATPPF